MKVKWKNIEMATMQARGLFLTRRRQKLRRAGGRKRSIRRAGVIVIMFSIFIFSQCTASNADTIKNEKCKQMTMKLSEMLADYYKIDYEQSYVHLDSALAIPSSEIDSVLASKDINDIYKYEKLMPICQYYFYRAQIEGRDKILNEVDSLQQNINGNQEFFDLT